MQNGHILLVEGMAQREAEVINVIVQWIGPLGAAKSTIPSQLSRGYIHTVAKPLLSG